MAGTIVTSVINNDTGLFQTNNAYLGIAKAWVNFQGGNGNTAGTINGSFNVSSITVNGTGDYTVNFSTAFANTNYTPVTGLLNSTGNRATSAYSSSTSSVSVYAYACSSGANSNPTSVYVSVFSA